MCLFTPSVGIYFFGAEVAHGSPPERQMATVWRSSDLNTTEIFAVQLLWIFIAMNLCQVSIEFRPIRHL